METFYKVYQDSVDNAFLIVEYPDDIIVFDSFSFPEVVKKWRELSGNDDYPQVHEWE